MILELNSNIDLQGLLQNGAVCAKVEYRSGAHIKVREHRSAEFRAQCAVLRKSPNLVDEEVGA